MYLLHRKSKYLSYNICRELIPETNISYHKSGNFSGNPPVSLESGKSLCFTVVYVYEKSAYKGVCVFFRGQHSDIM